MAINPNLLVAAPMMQNLLIDKDNGLPMADGTITMYQDNSRTTLKNWYFQSGVAGAYTYITLPNPLTLSGIGTITDPSGNNTVPFYYPYSEVDNITPQPYYVVVQNSNGEGEFTLQNFPFVPSSGGTPGTTIPTNQNLIVNGEFWRNIGSLNGSAVTSAIIAPDQHDGFSMPEMRFIKNIAGATDTITFNKFAAGTNPLQNDITPEYYCNVACTAAQTGETLKVIQIPISLHIKNLEGVTASVVLHAQNQAGSNSITLNLYQFAGTGVTSPAPGIIQTIPLTGGWVKYVIPFTFPLSTGVALGNGGDDAFYLQIGIPLSQLCNFNFAKPQIYLCTPEQVPTNQFQTYDQIDAVIGTPRTGDTRTSINAFSPFGWVPMNNGTLGNPTSNATTRATQDAWQLFSVIWNLAKTYDTGATFNPIAQMYTSAGSTTNFGATAIADFNANNALALTKMLGQVVMGSVPIASLLAIYNQTITASNSGGNLLITITNGTVLYNYQPITFTTTGTLPGGIVANAVYYVTNLAGTSFNVATTFANAIAGTAIVFTSAGTGTSNVILSNTGALTGESAHTLSIAEMPSHTHPPLTGTAFREEIASGGSLDATGGMFNIFAATTGATGGSSAHNNLQPSTFYNIFMKL